jgi:hypothetical protein
MGPERTGPAFHVDPYRTGAWNAVIFGSKRWTLYPWDDPPPGTGLYPGINLLFFVTPCQARAIRTASTTRRLDLSDGTRNTGPVFRRSRSSSSTKRVRTCFWHELGIF